jgi:large subunit ribosomal protein L18
MRLTNTKIIAQVAQWNPKGDEIIVGIDSTILRKLGWKGSLKGRSAAYLTGMLIAKKAGEKNVTEGILDSGFRSIRKGNKMSLFLKGAIDAGMAVPHAEEVIPPDDMIADKDTQAIKGKIQ